MAGIENLEYKKVEEKLGKSLYERVFNKLDKESKDKVLEQANNTQITKDALKDLMKSMFREKNRKTQFEELLKNGNDNQKKLLQGKNIDTISAHDLLMIENEGTGFLSASFAYKETKDESGEIIETPFDGTVKEKDIIKIDFGKNKNANYKIGAGDILPANIKVVKIKDEKGNERVGVRSIGKKSNGSEKVGYYDKAGYIPVFNNYTMEIPTKEESEKIIKDLSKDVEISNDENAEKEVKNKYLEAVAKEEEREDKIRNLTLEQNKPFMENAKILATEIEKVYGIPWQVTVGQASLESNWGKSGLAADYNNIFGIKSFGKGNSVSMNTNEYEGGEKLTVKDGFRVYGDMKESFIDYAKFLINNPRYSNAFKYASNLDTKPEYYPSDYIGCDPEKFIYEVAKAGYATDPNYANLVASTWKKYDSLETKVA